MTTTWALIADRDHASIFETQGRTKALTRVEHYTHTAGHIDDPTASREGEPAPERAPTEADALKFAHELAVKLKNAHSTHRFEQLVLAAEPGFLGMLRKVIDPVTARTIVGEVRKHLGSHGDGDLQAHLAPAIPL